MHQERRYAYRAGFWFVVALALAAVTGTSVTASAASPATGVVNLSLSPSTITAQVGQSFDENLVIDTGTDRVSAAEIHLTFDPTKLQVQSFAASGTLLPEVLAAATYDNSAGTAAIVLGSPATSPASGTGSLATMRFTAIASGSGSISYANGTQTPSIGKTSNSLNSASGSSITVTGSPPAASEAPVVLLTQPQRLVDTRSGTGGYAGHRSRLVRTVVSLLLVRVACRAMPAVWLSTRRPSVRQLRAG
jgi:hypothetical protein